MSSESSQGKEFFSPNYVKSGDTFITFRICCLLIALTKNFHTEDPEKLSSSSEENLDTAREAFDLIYKMAEEFAGEDLTDVEAPLETETEDEQEGEVSAGYQKPIKQR